MVPEPDTVIPSSRLCLPPRSCAGRTVVSFVLCHLFLPMLFAGLKALLPLCPREQGFCLNTTFVLGAAGANSSGPPVWETTRSGNRRGISSGSKRVKDPSAEARPLFVIEQASPVSQSERSFRSLIRTLRKPLTISPFRAFRRKVKSSRKPAHTEELLVDKSPFLQQEHTGSRPGTLARPPKSPGSDCTLSASDGKPHADNSLRRRVSKPMPMEFRADSVANKLEGGAIPSVEAESGTAARPDAPSLSGPRQSVAGEPSTGAASPVPTSEHIKRWHKFDAIHEAIVKLIASGYLALPDAMPPAPSSQ